MERESCSYSKLCSRNHEKYLCNSDILAEHHCQGSRLFDKLFMPRVARENKFKAILHKEKEISGTEKIPLKTSGLIPIIHA
jgi:hypothetical protein